MRRRYPKLAPAEKERVLKALPPHLSHLKRGSLPSPSPASAAPSRTDPQPTRETHTRDRDRKDCKAVARALIFVALATKWTAMGCAARTAPQVMQADRIDWSIRRYETAAAAVNLSDSKEQVLSVLDPSQAELLSSERKPADHYVQNAVVVDIFYFRSRRFPDGLTTDDEFTP